MKTEFEQNYFLRCETVLQTEQCYYFVLMTPSVYNLQPELTRQRL